MMENQKQEKGCFGHGYPSCEDRVKCNRRDACYRSYDLTLQKWMLVTVGAMVIVFIAVKVMEIMSY